MNASGHSGLCASLLSSVLVEPVDPRRLLGMVNVASTFAAGYPGPPLPVVSTHQAFVVGVNEYSGAGFRPLTKAVNDAVDVAAALETGGFSVHSFANLPRSQFVRHGVADHQIWARFWIGKDSASFGQDLGPRLCEVFGSGRGPNLDLILGPRGFQDVGMFMDIWHKGPILPRFGGSAWLS